MRKFIGQFERVAEFVCTLAFAAIFCIFLAGVVARYAVGQPIQWADESCMILLLWCVFLADAFVIRENEHIAFDIFWDIADERGRRLIAIGASLIGLVIFAAAAPLVWDYILFLWRERTATLGWRLDYVFACFGIYFTMVAVRLAYKLVRLCTAGWRELVARPEGPSMSNIIG